MNANASAMAEPTIDSAHLQALPPTPRRALFLDRDGVVNVDYGYVHSPERTEWVPGIFELVAAAREAGLICVVVTNQAGIARGYYDEAEFRAYTRWVHERFRERGAPLLATYHCPHHPHAGDDPSHCGCRKPEPGMLLAAIRDFGIDPARSILIGDKVTDIVAARRAQVGFSILVGDTDAQPSPAGTADPVDLAVARVATLDDALAVLRAQAPSGVANVGA